MFLRERGTINPQSAERTGLMKHAPPGCIPEAGARPIKRIELVGDHQKLLQVRGGKC